MRPGCELWLPLLLLLWLPRAPLAQPATAPDASPVIADSTSADPPLEDGKLTCFTCTNVTDNDQCNRFAIDRPCEPGLSLCRTDHLVERSPGNTRPRSVRITKTCVAASECTRGAVGCRAANPSQNGAQSVCTSCCDWSYCNELAPADSPSAVLALSRSGAQLPSAFPILVLFPAPLLLFSVHTQYTMWPRL